MTKRYDMKDSYSGAWMTEVADGDWVGYDDHVAALAAAESRGFEKGRAEERRDVVAFIDDQWCGRDDDVHGLVGDILEDLRSAAHVGAAKETP
jgi:hypothetical protein